MQAKNNASSFWTLGSQLGPLWPRQEKGPSVSGLRPDPLLWQVPGGILGAISVKGSEIPGGPSKGQAT